MSQKRGPPPLMSVFVQNYDQFFRSAENTANRRNDYVGDSRDFQKRQFQGPGPRQNVIEKRLNQALRQPVELGKGESMMKKMGWSGGGLGRSGEGIVEPIAPNAAYATNKQGLGKAEIQENFDKRNVAKPQIKRYKHPIGPKTTDNQCSAKELKKTKQSQKPKKSEYSSKSLRKARKKQLRGILITAVLEQMIDFVQNEREVELLLDKNLTNVERKTVHKLVEQIRDNTFSGYNIIQMDLIRKLNKYNDYDLNTESSGKPPDRQLGIYKDPKDCMFLVIPEDLREDDNGDNEKEKIDPIEENIDHNDLIDWVEEENSSSDGNSIDTKNVIKDGEINDATDYAKMTKQSYIEYINLCNKISRRSIIDKELTFKRVLNKEEYRAKVAKEKQQLFFKDELAENVSKRSFTVTEVLGKIVKYFVDFGYDDSLKEFRFLGLFNEIEYEAVGLFFDICSGDSSDNSEAAEKLRKVFDSKTHCFKLGENSNGTTIVLKERKE